jgi:hypothetical protein
MTFNMTVRANNVAMALRQLDATKATLTYGLLGCTTTGTVTGISAAFQTDGSAILNIQGQAPGLIGASPPFLPLTTNICMTAQLGVLADHPLLDGTSTGAGSTGWFVRNEWYRLVWYQVARRNTVHDSNVGIPVGTPPDCIAPPFTPPVPPTSSQCLGFNATQNLRAILVLTGQSLSNPAGRPNATLSDYLEWGNCDPDFFGVCSPSILYEQRWVRPSKRLPGGVPVVRAPSNDRVVLVDWKGAAPTFPIGVLP